ncbi:CD151 antigen-like [Salvelinus namaycush]|uniref:CD151 antigen-like n=1 Tax=Salvelinus namaycush TaxID=8040 RepID=A0A8U0Q415_SALNM|nr:CD151 antigen-like [Salvelinus namaycush]
MFYQVSGLAPVLVGTISRPTYTEMESFTHTSQGLSHTSILLIVVGIIVSLLAFLGSIGAWSDSRLLLGLFTHFLMLILSLQIVSGILFYVFRNKINMTLPGCLNLLQSWMITVERRITLKVNEVIMQHCPRDKVAIDDLQHAFRCCGAENYTDWLLQGSRENISFVPHSCCHVDSVACVKVVTTDNIYQRVNVNQHRGGRGGYKGLR